VAAARGDVAPPPSLLSSALSALRFGARAMIGHHAVSVWSGYDYDRFGASGERHRLPHLHVSAGRNLGGTYRKLVLFLT